MLRAATGRGGARSARPWGRLAAARRVRRAVFPFAIGCASLLNVLVSSPAIAGTPNFNLPWYLQDVVVASQMTPKNYAKWRLGGSVFATEMELRKASAPNDIWLKHSGNRLRSPNLASCSHFEVRTFSDWLIANQSDARSVPQWRELWHGVATLTKVKQTWTAKVKRVTLTAAVTAPGLPNEAFNPTKPGALRPEAFRTASQFKSAGFNRMFNAVKHLNMNLLRTEVCDGFTLYIWELN